MTEILNARIKSTKLGIQEGLFTAWLSFEGRSWGCVFGGISFDSYCQYKDEREPVAIGAKWIAAVLKTLGVNLWEDLDGKYCRVEIDSEGNIKRIGHIIEDQWFDQTSLLINQLQKTP